MHDFTYHRPLSLEDAVAAIKAAEDGRLLAGGQTLLPALKQRLAAPTDLIDLGALRDLKELRQANDGRLLVGAMATHAEVADSAVVRRAIPALAALAGDIGDPQVRHRGTLGGSIANNDPAADYPAALLALDAGVETDRGAISAERFFTGLFETALDEAEIVTRVAFPVPDRAAYAKFHNPASRYAIAGVFVAQFGEAVRLAVTGAGPCVFRVAAMEQALAEEFSPGAVADIHVAEDDLNSDLHASAAFRAHLVTVMAQRAVAACA
jgi:carbon-monoxide dehydrogenase medium subunit